ncbi:soluble lytic murein transglycosylase [Volucribacter psittacicida]|uniref:Soluble lytic murein transglycosylase n=1 Tax=Volucribacter psittacicida TaxID=203482 RepID=A0A4R1G4S7_9PAST|nr:transglycosylase SLT domain-containing protein [Volucribacter psittacicida]TCJ98691.1 soluble lytic murein transglycosylase [Volucribacter psittacicida]
MKYKILWASYLCLLFHHTVQAEPIQAIKQDEVYQKLNQIIQQNQSQGTLNLVENMLPELKNYPLYPYAQFQLLNAKAQQNQFNVAEIAQFNQQYPDLPNYFVSTLTTNWFNTQFNQQHWQAIVDNQERLTDSVANRCLLMQAEINLTSKETALLSTAQQQNIQQLWLTGQNLPTNCASLVALWQQQTPLSTALITQRAILAFQQKNTALLNQLVALAPENTWLKDIQQLLQRPQRLPDFAEKAENNADNQAIILAIFPTFIRQLGEDQWTISENPFAPYQVWADKFALTEPQVKQWKSQFLWQIFDSDIALLQQWRDQQILQLKEDRQTERRIRLAIRQQQDLSPWLAVLSDNAKQSQEWRYWQAYTLQKQGKKQQSEQILKALSQQRGFYPMLAAQELGIVYHPNMAQIRSQVRQQTNLNAFQTALQRIQSLYQLGQQANQQQINREWWALLSSADKSQKLLLSEYANQQQWFDLAVEATIQAKAWDYLALRLPNAYLNWFDLQLKNNPKIDRTFAMAIARQESAWKSYAQSSANAQGLMQLLPTTAQATAKKYQLPYWQQAQLFDPFYNIMLGTAHLQELAERYGENRILIAAAYNAGSSRVDNWLARSQGKLTMAEFIATIPFYETRGYVQNVLTYDYYYQILQQKPLIKFSKTEYDRLY